MCGLLRRDILHLRTYGVDNLLLAHLAREIVAFRTDHIPISRIRQGPLSIEVMPSLRESILEEVVIEAALTIDVDAAEVVDDFLEGGEIDADECVDGLGEDFRNRIAQKAGTFTRISALFADGVRVIHAMRSVRGDRHP